MEIRLCSSLLLKVSEYMHYIPTTITSILVIRFGRMSNGWKSEEINYDFDIGSLLRLHSVLGQKHRFLRLFSLLSIQFQQMVDFQKFIIPKPFIVSGRVNNRWKDEKLVYNITV
jgi:hypothetical protein